MRFLLAVALLLVLQASEAAETCKDIRNLKEIKIRPGVNSVANFDEYGRTAKIVMASYFGETAHQGYQTYFIYTEDEDKSGPEKKIVEARGGSAVGATVTGYPFDGEFTTRTVRFARGTCDKEAHQVFMFIATRMLKQAEHGHYDSVPVEIEIYKLMPGEEIESDVREDWFERISVSTSAEKFGSADAALELKFRFSPGSPPQ